MIDDIVIRAEGLGKSYVIDHRVQREKYVAMRDVLARKAKALGRKACGLFHDSASPTDETIEEFWALKDVSFEVKRGDVLGVIGRNGAGKSTLLKILSRITEPTTGRVHISGRVASLLEVGTGFHPELTGRENIFLSGAILGMRRGEVRRKFDAIVSFAGVEKFLDTPVKRYSSGMYVRLGFAIAAHLDPEILVIDEVLAVGDAQFQKACLGRMQEVSGQDRTVLFVSHNMAMIGSLCEKAILLEKGQLCRFGPTEEVILAYSANGAENSPARINCRNAIPSIGDQHVLLLSADVRNEDGLPVSQIEITRPFSVRMEYRIISEGERVYIPNFHFYRHDGSCAFVTSAVAVGRLAPGEYAAECYIPSNFLNDGLYSVELAITSYESHMIIHFHERGGIMFNVHDPIEEVPTRAGYAGPMPGALRPTLPWTVKSIA